MYRNLSLRTVTDPWVRRPRPTTSRTLSTTRDRRIDDLVPRRGRRGARVRPGRRRLLGHLHPVAEPDQILGRRHLQQQRQQLLGVRRRRAGARRRRRLGEPARLASSGGRPAAAATSSAWSSAISRSASSLAVGHGRPHGRIEVLLLGGQVPGQRGDDHLATVGAGAASYRRRSARSQSASSSRCSRRCTSTTLRPVVSPPTGGQRGKIQSRTRRRWYPTPILRGKRRSPRA